MSGMFDSIVIGGGHNGLVCAAYLARGGQRVLVLEAADRLGGAAATDEFAPGFRVSSCAHLLHMLPRSLVADLRLASHGLQMASEALPTTALSPQGLHLRLTPSGGAGLSPGDATAYGPFIARMRRLAAHLRPLLDRTPPRLGTSDWQDHAGLLRMAWQVRSLGQADMRELLRIIGMNVHDLAEDSVESSVLRGAIGFDAVLGGNAGPRAPGTVLTLLYRLAAEAGAVPMAQPKGGMGALAEALAGAARSAGATLRTGARVARVLVQNDRAAGVVLQDGETIAARNVISSADPRTTFLDLLGASHLDTGFVRHVVHFRDRGVTAKLHLALSAPPEFRGLDPSALAGRLIIAPSLDYLENAFNPTKYGDCSQDLPMEIVVPSVADPSLAPPGQHVLSAVVQYAPFAPREGWHGLRQRLTDSLIGTLDSYAPGLRRLVLAAELLSPADLAARYNSAGGHWHHGELAFDQFFMVRPLPGAAQYRAPVDNLFLCGAGAHPGGGVMGVAGRNAARQVLHGHARRRAA